MSDDPYWYMKLVNGHPVPFAAAAAERIFNRDAIVTSSPLSRVQWATGEATFNLQTDGCELGEIRILEMTGFTCVVLLERLYELLAEAGGIYISLGDFLVAREDELGCFGADSTTEVVLVRSGDEFIEAAQIVFMHCGPEANVRTA